MCDSSYKTIGILLSLLIHAQASSHGLGQWQNCLSPCHTHLITCTYWRVYVSGEKQINKQTNLWPLKLHSLRSGEREKMSLVSPSSPKTTDRSPCEHTDIPASAGTEETCPSGHLFSQINIIVTVSPFALSQHTGSLTEELQEDAVFSLPRLKEPGENHTLFPATLQKIVWKPEMIQASPAYFDGLNQHKTYNTSWRNKRERSYNLQPAAARDKV